MQETMTSKRTVVGLFDNMEDANRAATELETRGIRRNEISLIASNEAGKYADYSSGTGEVGKGIAGGAGAGAAIGGGLGLLAGLTALAIPGFGPVIAAGPIAAALTGAGIGAAAGGLIGGLSNAGVSEEDAHLYEEGVRRGGVLLSLRTTDDKTDEAADILDRNGAKNIDEKSREWEKAGWKSGYSAARTSTTTGSKDTAPGDRKIPVVEERLNVGKREVSKRGVRVYSNVTNRPVEENIDLRDEKIHVERRPADRPATEKDFAAFKEGTIELTEVREEPVVSKTARVVEEVVVGKEVDHHTETVRDNVRRTDVKVENTGDLSSYDNDFRADYQKRYATSGRNYDYYKPAYQFGTTYASDAKYRDRDWDAVEPGLRKDWESRGHGTGQGTWEDFKDSVRYGWDRVRGRR